MFHPWSKLIKVTKAWKEWNLSYEHPIDNPSFQIDGKKSRRSCITSSRWNNYYNSSPMIKRRKRDERNQPPLLLLSQTRTPRSSASRIHARPRISKPFRRTPTSRRNKFSSSSQARFSLSLLPYFFRHLSLLFTTGENSLKIRGRKVSSLPTVCPPLSTFFSNKRVLKVER